MSDSEILQTGDKNGNFAVNWEKKKFVIGLLADCLEKSKYLFFLVKWSLFEIVMECKWVYLSQVSNNCSEII